MQKTDDRLSRIQDQFRRQADVYEKLPDVSDTRGHTAIVSLSKAEAGDRVLDVACGPGFLTMAFAQQCRSACALTQLTPLSTTRATKQHAETSRM